jgi:hypothetical protein
VCVPQSIDDLAELPAVRTDERRDNNRSVNSMQGDASWAS